MRKFRIRGAYLHSPISLHGVVLNYRAKFTFLALVLTVYAHVNKNVKILSIPFLFQGVELTHLFRKYRKMYSFGI
jgi:hypothetical protein